MTLDGNDHFDWLALLRVRGGHVSKQGDRYAYRGQPFPDVSLLAAALHGLAAAGMLTLAEPDEHGLATVALTEAGLARYKALDKGRRAQVRPAGRYGPLKPRPAAGVSQPPRAALPAAGRSPKLKVVDLAVTTRGGALGEDRVRRD